MATRHFIVRRHHSKTLFLLLLTLWFFGFLVFEYLERGRDSAQAVVAREMHFLGETAQGHSCICSSNETIPTASLQHSNTSSTNILVHNQRDQENTTSHENYTPGCDFPDIDPFDPAVMAVTDFFPPVSCAGGVPHLVYVDGDTIKVNHSKTSLFNDQNNRFKECMYRSIGKKPGSDFDTIVLYNSTWFNDSITLRDNDDNLVVECYSNNNDVLSRSYFSLIRVKKDLEKKLEERLYKHIAKNSPKEIFNVLMIGIDGNSKQNFERHMPKTRNYILKVLNALELHKYNKQGDHTYPNVIPILTGKLEEELVYPNWTWRQHFDYANKDFVWSDFSRAGYRTGFYLDSTKITFLHFKKKGWDKPPVDYYYRATLLELERDPLMTYKYPYCVGDIPEVAYKFNFWTQMASTFNNSKTQPYFGFSFNIHLTHDEPNGASAGDDLYLRFLVELKQKNIINNTIIIFFSDHGPRVGNVRFTYNGMIEAMTPLMFLIFPPWFHQKYPDIVKVLKINQDRLTTNKDIHATLLDILNFQGKPGIGDIKQKVISLFNEIPRERTCDDAGIPFEFCVCNKLVAGNFSSVLTFSLGTVILDRLYLYIENNTDICMKHSLKSVDNVMRMEFQNFKKNEGDHVYLVRIVTSPGDAVYEAHVMVYSTKILQVMGHVRRLNLYRGQDKCTENPQLKPYCYCMV